MLKEYFSIAEILEFKLEGYLDRRNLEIKTNNENWLFRVANLSHSDKPVREYHISNFPAQVREKIVNKLLEKQRLEKQIGNLTNIEKIERIAYAKFEIIYYVESNKVKMANFITEYNNKQAPLSTSVFIDDTKLIVT